MRTTAANPCDYCEHANWQHAREGDARLETEDYAIGQCYVNGCDCDDFQPRATTLNNSGQLSDVDKYLIANGLLD